MCGAGISIFTDSPSPRGANDPSPGGRLFKAPASRVGYRHPFFRRGHRGLLCGAGMEPSRGRGRPSGARESQLFLGYVITKVFSKTHLDIITTTTEDHHTILKYNIMKENNVSCEIEDLIETHLCKLRGILRSRVLGVLCDLIKNVSPY